MLAISIDVRQQMVNKKTQTSTHWSQNDSLEICGLWKYLPKKFAILFIKSKLHWETIWKSLNINVNQGAHVLPANLHTILPNWSLAVPQVHGNRYNLLSKALLWFPARTSTHKRTQKALNSSCSSDSFHAVKNIFSFFNQIIVQFGLEGTLKLT